MSGKTPHVEVWRRNEGGRWELADEAQSGTVTLASLDVGDVYANPLATAAT